MVWISRFFCFHCANFTAGAEFDKFPFSLSCHECVGEKMFLSDKLLGTENLISLEADPIVHKRQLFNLRPSYIKCREETTADFVSNFDSFVDNYRDKEFIIWFDYASPRERREQIIEYQTLLGKLQTSDILKITMNANPHTLGEQRSDESVEDIQKRRLEVLNEQLDSFLPATPIEHTQMTKRGIVHILCDAIRISSLNATQNTSKQAVPLAIFVYQDGPHQMLTVTIRLMQDEDVENFLNELIDLDWEYLPLEWNNFTKINVPNLTAKERLYIEELLFAKDHQDILKELPFQFHSNSQKSLEILEEYARHYNRYPSYFQVVL
jgi:hypothetical protein